jgi:hypothetical protein
MIEHFFYIFLFFFQIDRWDSPLIELREDEETPFNELVDILIN